MRVIGIIDGNPALANVGAVAARRGDALVVITWAGLTWRRRHRLVRELLTPAEMSVLCWGAALAALAS